MSAGVKEVVKKQREKLEHELEELSTDLSNVNRTLKDLDLLVERNQADDSFAAMRTKLRGQADVIERSRKRIKHEMEELSQHEQEGTSPPLPPTSSWLSGNSIQLPLISDGPRVRKFRSTISRLWVQFVQAYATEDAPAVDDPAKGAFERDLEALEDRIKSLSKQRREVEEQERLSIERAFDEQGSGSLGALRQELRDDVRIKEEIDSELADIAVELDQLRLRIAGISDPIPSRVNRGPITIEVDVKEIQRLLDEQVEKFRSGSVFCVRSVKLLGLDCYVAGRLLVRATQGYPTTSKEWDHMRRFVTDVLALIPFSILLAIPLSPVGHLVLFAAIQKYVPALFPSTFKPERVKVMERLEALQQAQQELRSLSPPPDSHMDS
eukprot:CAMPEP_0184658408 /NCGR_PEP_ID=MMETSP0308-20130426/25242_1 /TAXON_ID=38269 /ORGANISM="Gloeochaete witrockiana, Strain SAG 46.84" /LENGTH=380 /DNA_ID=CAMNT_0027097361 /DNA_START=318 /DNA_END=1460 /DNA_ORIENTATION=+